MHLYLAIFGVVLSTLILPLPEELALLGVGYLAQQGQVRLAGAFADAASYYVGRFLLARLLATRFGQRLIRPDRRRWAEDLVRRQGWRAIVLGRFLVALRGPVYFAVGASKYPARRFLIINSLVGLVEVALVVALGYFFGKGGALAGKVRWIDAAIALTILITFTLPWAFGRWLRVRARA